MSSITSKQRILGSAENALVDLALQHRGYMKVGTVLHLQGPQININELQTAVNYLQQRHPFLRSRLKHNPDNDKSYLMEEDSNLRLKIREIPRKRDEYLDFWRQEWREHEKDVPIIGEALAEFCLFQDPDDAADDTAPREILFICEHSICDGISISVVAHELLIALGDNDKSLFEQRLDWPVTVEEAIQRTPITAQLPQNSNDANHRIIGHIPSGKIDFSLDDMANYCHTEASYGFLSEEETKAFFAKCHSEKITVTSAISAAVLCSLSKLIDTETTQLTVALGTDTRRRCQPSVPDHDLSYHVSTIPPFAIAQQDISNTIDGMWQLANTFSQYLTNSIEQQQILTIGALIGSLYRMSMGPINLAFAPTCTISNWGLSSFRKCYGQWTLINVLPIVNLVRTVCPLIIVQTVNDSLLIGYLGANPFLSSETFEILRDSTMDYLRQMIK